MNAAAGAETIATAVSPTDSSQCAPAATHVPPDTPCAPELAADPGTCSIQPVDAPADAVLRGDGAVPGAGLCPELAQGSGDSGAGAPPQQPEQSSGPAAHASGATDSCTQPDSTSVDGVEPERQRECVPSEACELATDPAAATLDRGAEAAGQRDADAAIDSDAWEAVGMSTAAVTRDAADLVQHVTPDAETSVSGAGADIGSQPAEAAAGSLGGDDVAQCRDTAEAGTAEQVEVEAGSADVTEGSGSAHNAADVANERTINGAEAVLGHVAEDSTSIGTPGAVEAAESSGAEGVETQGQPQTEALGLSLIHI